MFKRLCFLNMILGFSLIATAQQSLSGIWKDTLRISAKQELEVVFVISKTDTAWTCVMDSPMQYVTNIPVTTFSYQSENDSLKITSKPLNMKFIGKYNSSEDVV